MGINTDRSAVESALKRRHELEAKEPHKGRCYGKNNVQYVETGSNGGSLVLAGILGAGLGVAGALVLDSIFSKKPANTNNGGAPSNTNPGPGGAGGANDSKTSSDALLKAISDAQNNGTDKVNELKAKTDADADAQQAKATEIANMTTQPQTDFDKLNGQLGVLNGQYKAENDKLPDAKKAESDAENAATAADTKVETAKGKIASIDAQIAACGANTELAAQKVELEAKKKEAEAELKTAEQERTAAYKLKADKQKERADLEAKIKDLSEQIKAKKTEVDTAKKALDAAKAEQAKLKAANDRWGQTIATAYSELAKYGINKPTDTPAPTATEPAAPAAGAPSAAAPAVQPAAAAPTTAAPAAAASADAPPIGTATMDQINKYLTDKQNALSDAKATEEEVKASSEIPEQYKATALESAQKASAAAEKALKEAETLQDNFLNQINTKRAEAGEKGVTVSETDSIADITGKIDAARVEAQTNFEAAQAKEAQALATLKTTSNEHTYSDYQKAKESTQAAKAVLEKFGPVAEPTVEQPAAAPAAAEPAAAAPTTTTNTILDQLYAPAELASVKQEAENMGIQVNKDDTIATLKDKIAAAAPKSQKDELKNLSDQKTEEKNRAQDAFNKVQEDIKKLEDEMAQLVIKSDSNKEENKIPGYRAKAEAVKMLKSTKLPSAQTALNNATAAERKAHEDYINYLTLHQEER